MFIRASVVTQTLRQLKHNAMWKTLLRYIVLNVLKKIITVIKACQNFTTKVSEIYSHALPEKNAHFLVVSKLKKF